jgi:hypothetical protein
LNFHRGDNFVSPWRKISLTVVKLFFHHGAKSNDYISALIIYTYYDNALRRLQPIYALAVSLFTYLTNTAPIGL